MTNVEASATLQVIRRKEAQVKRRIVAEREAAEARLSEAEQQARELFVAAEAEGRRTGEVQLQVALAEAEREAEHLLAQARSEAELLQHFREQQMAAVVARAVATVIGGSHEA